MSASLAAAALTWLGSSTVFGASVPAPTGELFLRPLTSTEISTYGLTNAPVVISGGLHTVGVGEPFYLDCYLPNTFALSNVTSLTWTLTNGPVSSAATLLASPLGTNVPPFNPADKTFYIVAGRSMLIPDQPGFYTVNVAVTTTVMSNTTPVVQSTNWTVSLQAASYMGLNTCGSCHSVASVAPPIYLTYTNTPHASFFTLAIQGLESSHYGKSCIVCHVDGYDTNAAAAYDGSFFNVANNLGWSFPSSLLINQVVNSTTNVGFTTESFSITNTYPITTNWTYMNPQLQALGNIQCENCHGAGSQHPFSQGQFGNTNAVTVSYGAGDCSRCHDDLPTHYYSAEWNNSKHANMTRTPSGSSSRIACVRCHTAPGFIGYVKNLGNTNAYATNYLYEAVTCQACHDPHDATNPHELRVGIANYTLSDGTVVTNAGAGTMCFYCHNSRNGSVTNSLVNYALLQNTWNGGSSFGPHDSPQADMLEGVNAVTYGQVIPSAPHANVVSNTCVGCHMQTISSTDPAFTLAGGHSTLMSYTNKSGQLVDVTYVCQQCHGGVTNFNFLVPDYVGYGYSQGVQTQVQILLNQLSTLLPSSTYVASGNYVADGKVKSPSTQTNWPTKFLQAAYNWQFVNNDGSLGVHNADYAIGLLKASIANLTGVSTVYGLPDSWESQYFGPNFSTNSAAAPNAVNNSAGVPNWMMYALGLSPTSAFNVGTNGVVYLNGTNVVNGATNTVAIYTAAQLSFNTVVGSTYQIQGITALSGGWQNISTNIPGTGGTVSYLTPTHGISQMFFRVVHTP